MLGLRIKKRREELKLTQQELALKLGYKSRSSINKIEIGENDIPFSKLSEIATALNTTELYLLGIGQSQNFYFKKIISEVMHSTNLHVTDFDELRSKGIDMHYFDKIELEDLLRNPDQLSFLCLKLNIDYSKLISFLNYQSLIGDGDEDHYKNETSFRRALNNMMIKENKVFKPDKKYIVFPLYRSISCGNGLFVDDNIIELISLPESILNKNKEYFCQYAVGDSMVNENINEGDLLVFEKTSVIENGQIGCFCIDDNIATCKKFYKDTASAIITLQPANPKYAPIIVTVENMNFHVVGKLILVINKRG